MRSIVDLAGGMIDLILKFSLLELFVLLWLFVIIRLFIAIDLHKFLDDHFWCGFSSLNLQQFLVVIDILLLDLQQIILKIEFHTLKFLLFTVFFGIFGNDIDGLTGALHIDFIFLLYPYSVIAPFKSNNFSG